MARAIAKWLGVGVVCLSPLLMGVDGCVHIPNAQWINATDTYGYLDADGPIGGDPSDPIEPGPNGPNPACADDPFGLQNYINLRHNLDLWIGQGAVPSFTWGNPTGTSSAALPSGHGWYSNHGYLPTKVMLRFDPFPGQPTVHSIFFIVPQVEFGACAPGSTGRCDFLRIGATVGGYEINSGWRIPATGQVCLTRWTGVPMHCDYTRVLYSYWETCWLPTAVNQLPNFGGVEP